MSCECGWRPLSHDHLQRCSRCGMPISDVRDCVCASPHYVVYRLCGSCREDQAYEDTERRRNADY